MMWNLLFPHLLHENGLIPEWVWRCRFKLVFVWKLFPQSRQISGRSSVCVIMWAENIALITTCHTTVFVIICIEVKIYPRSKVVKMSWFTLLLNLTYQVLVFSIGSIQDLFWQDLTGLIVSWLWYFVYSRIPLYSMGSSARHHIGVI